MNIWYGFDPKIVALWESSDFYLLQITMYTNPFLFNCLINTEWQVCK